MRKGKKQIIGEEVSDESTKLFLDVESADDMPPSLHKLIKTYRGLRIDDFEHFLAFFREAGYDLDVRDAKGNDFVALVADQRQAASYIETLQAARDAWASHTVKSPPFGGFFRCVARRIPPAGERQHPNDGWR